jgi:hypothetical protein
MPFEALEELTARYPDLGLRLTDAIAAERAAYEQLALARERYAQARDEVDRLIDMIPRKPKEGTEIEG